MDSFTAIFPLVGKGKDDILIAPFWDDISTVGDVYFRVCSNQTVLAQAGTFISQQFSAFSVDFTPDFLLIATWDQVAAFLASTNPGV